MNSELIFKYEFNASHSLAQYEKEHSHLWKVEVVIAGNLQGDKILDIPFARSIFQKELNEIAATYLNENRKISSAAQASPTCETLGQHFFKVFSNLSETQLRPLNASVRFKSITVTLCDMDGSETGAARFFA